MPVPRTIIAHGLGLLVCVSAIEGGLYLFAQRAGTLHDLDRRVKFVEDSIASGAHSSDVIILGDSTGYLGADPATFSGIAGVSSFNFASAISIAPIADRQFLEQYFRHDPPPKAVVLVRMIEGWSGHYNEASVRKYFPGAAATAQAYGKSLGSPESVLRSLFSLLPSYRYKNTIHELLYTRLVGSSRGPGNTAEVPTEVSGFLPVDSPVTADEIGQLVRGDKATVTTTDIFLPLAENIELLNALCRVARDHHTPLIVSSSPVMTAHLLNPYYQAAVDKAEQVLRADLTTQPGCTWHDAPYWDQRLFHDPQHLNATGAALFGRQLGTYYLQDVAR